MSTLQSLQPIDLHHESASTEPDPRQGEKGIAFISFLRGAASLLVVWDHLVASWNDNNGRTFLPLTISREYLAHPLGIIQDFGYFGVAIFFFVSGFIITHVAQREGQIAFALKRILRIYPSLIISIIVIAAIEWIQFRATHVPGDLAGLSLSDYLGAMMLWNFFTIPQRNPVNGVAWTLVIEMSFYALCFLMLPLMRRLPKVASALLTLFVAVVLFRSRDFGDRFFLFAADCAYLPLLLIGQSTYLLWAGRAKTWQYVLLLTGNYLVFIYGLRTVQTAFYPADNSYGVSSIYAYLLFLICMFAGMRLRVPRVINFYSTISYSLYLYHGAIGLVLLSLLVRHIGPWWPATPVRTPWGSHWQVTGFAVAIWPILITVTLFSYFTWRFIEVPGQNLARRLIKAMPFAVGIDRSWYTMATPLILLGIGVWLGGGQTVAQSPNGPAKVAADASLAINQDSSPEEPDQLRGTEATTRPAGISTEDVEGSLDELNANRISGWVWFRNQAKMRVAVAVYIDGKFAGVAMANKPRTDLLDTKKGDGVHGFLIEAPQIMRDGGRHRISVRVDGMEQDLDGSPREVEKSGGKDNSLSH